MQTIIVHDKAAAHKQPGAVIRLRAQIISPRRSDTEPASELPHVVLRRSVGNLVFKRLQTLETDSPDNRAADLGEPPHSARRPGHARTTLVHAHLPPALVARVAGLVPVGCPWGVLVV
jgi:hypothetical protein